MKRPIFRLIALFLPFCGFILSGAARADEGFQVVVSIKPIHAIVAGLMEGIEGPELVVDGEQTVYGFTPSDEQKQRIQRANLVIWVGAELEPWMPELLGKHKTSPDHHAMELLSLPSLKILPLRDSDNLDSRDPFFWMDSRNAVILADELTRALIDADPGRAHVYRRNWKKVHAQLLQIDRELEYGYRGMKGGAALLYFDTLQYFAQAYALKIGDALVPSPNHAVPAAKLLKARAAIKDGEYACLLLEASLEDKAKELDLLTEGTGINVGRIDSFGATLPAGPELYSRLINQNTEIIKRCINAEKTETAATTITKVLPEDTGSVGEGHFILIDHLGREVTDQDMRSTGKYQMLYFGYTFCPDICPTSLQVMSQALDLLGAKADEIQPYFITIDPERDTVEKMRDYVQYFNERLIGLTGTKAMTDRVAKIYRVLYEKVTEDAPSPDMYLMDHSASVYLIAPDGRFITKFAHGITPQAMAKRLDEIIP
ncbi:MAG TPA: hypothetical protein EYH03_04535 [Chromatiales bacterium]|nr:hypothetical protein [Chromatiales bacterium]